MGVVEFTRKPVYWEYTKDLPEQVFPGDDGEPEVEPDLSVTPPPPEPPVEPPDEEKEDEEEEPPLPPIEPEPPAEPPPTHPRADYTAKEFLEALNSTYTDQAAQILFDNYIFENTGFDPLTEGYKKAVEYLNIMGITVDNFKAQIKAHAFGIHGSLFEGFAFTTEEKELDRLKNQNWETLFMEEEELVSGGLPTKIYSPSGLLSEYGSPLPDGSFFIDSSLLGAGDFIIVDDNLNEYALPEGWGVRYTYIDGQAKIMSLFSPQGWEFSPDGSAVSPTGSTVSFDEFKEYVTMARNMSGAPTAPLYEYLSYLNDGIDYSYVEDSFGSMSYADFISTLVVTTDDLTDLYSSGLGFTETEFTAAIKDVMNEPDERIRNAMLKELGLSDDDILKLEGIYLSKEVNQEEMLDKIVGMGIEKGTPLLKLLGFSEEDALNLFKSEAAHLSQYVWKSFSNAIAAANVPVAEKRDFWETVNDALVVGLGTAAYRVKSAFVYAEINGLMDHSVMLGDPTGYSEAYIPVQSYDGYEDLLRAYEVETAITGEARMEELEEKMAKLLKLQEDYINKYVINPEYMMSDYGGLGRFVNPTYYVDTILRTLPSTLAVMGAVIGGGMVAGPAGAIALGTLFGQHIEGAALYSELVAAGYEPEDAMRLSQGAGLVIGGIEALSDYALLSIATPVAGIFKNNFINGFFAGTKSAAIEGLKRGGATLITENLEEFFQGIVANAALHGALNCPLMSWEEMFSTAEQTTIATLPFAFIGFAGGVSGKYQSLVEDIVKDAPSLHNTPSTELLDGLTIRKMIDSTFMEGLIREEGWTDEQIADNGYVKDDMTGTWYHTMPAYKMLDNVYARLRQTDPEMGHVVAMTKAYNRLIGMDSAIAEQLGQKLQLAKVEYYDALMKAGKLRPTVEYVHRTVDFSNMSNRDAKLARDAVQTKEDVTKIIGLVEDAFTKSKHPLVKGIRFKIKASELVAETVHERNVRIEAKMRSYREEHPNATPDEMQEARMNMIASEPMTEVSFYFEQGPEQTAYIEEILKYRVEEKERAQFIPFNVQKAIAKYQSGEHMYPFEILAIIKELDPELTRTLDSIKNIERMLNKSLEKKNRGLEALKMLWYLPRVLMTSGDLSAIMRQGFGLLGEIDKFPVAIGHSLRAAYNLDMILGDRISHDTMTGEAFVRHRMSKLMDNMAMYQEAEQICKDRWGFTLFSDEKAPLSEQEEMFRGVMEFHIPVLSDILLDPSARTYAMFLNDLRYMVFMRYARRLDSLRHAGENITAEDYAQLIYTCNIMTGRGSFGRKGAAWSVDNMKGILSTVFFAPRLVLSYPQRAIHFANQGAGAFRGNKASEVMFRMMAKNFAADLLFVGGVTMLTQMAFAAMSDDDDWKKYLDPARFNLLNDERREEVLNNLTSVFSGRVKIGHTTIDLTGGYGSYLRAFFTIAQGERMKTATGEMVDADPMDILQQLGRGKLSPWIGLFVSIVTGKTFIGDDVVLDEDFAIETAFGMITPLNLQSFIEANGFHSFMEAMIVTLPEMFGMNVTTWDTRWWQDTIDDWGKEKPGYWVVAEDGKRVWIKDTHFTTSDLWKEYAIVFGTLTSEHMTPENIRLYQFTDMDVFFVKAMDTWRDYEALYVSGRYADMEANQFLPLYEEGVVTEEEYKAWLAYTSASPEAQARMEENPYYQKLIFMSGTEKKHLWLEEHPEENAILAFWGKIPTTKKFYSKAAYDKFMKYVEQFDAPLTGFPEGTLPPKGLEQQYFEYMDLSKEYATSSARMKQFLMENEELTEFLGLEIPDESKVRLDLKIKHEDNYGIFNAFSDSTSKQFIEDEADRKEAELSYLEKNEDFFKAYVLERIYTNTELDDDSVDALITEGGKYLDMFVAFQMEVIKNGYGSPEAMMYLAKDKEFHKWALDHGLPTNNIDIGGVKPSRYYELVSQLAEKDAEYNLLPDKASKREYMLMDQDYAMLVIEREAFENEIHAGMDVRHLELYKFWKYREFVGMDSWKSEYAEFFDMKPNDSCYVDEWWLMDNWGFYTTMVHLYETTGGEAGFASRDFTKARALREVWDEYMEYWTIEGKNNRISYRRKHPELDAYLVAFEGYNKVS